MPISRKTHTEKESQFFKNIGFKIQFLRKKAGMSQFELAEKADLSYATIIHLESTSVYGLSIVTIYRISRTLGVEPNQIMKFNLVPLSFYRGVFLYEKPALLLSILSHLIFF